MIPVRQTKFHDRARGMRGNCMRAALASLLDRALAEVPAFEEMADHEYWTRFFDWMNAEGYVFERFTADEQPRGFVIANGYSPRGVYHSTIYKDGVLVHDPHPSDAGIRSVQEYWQITRK